MILVNNKKVELGTFPDGTFRINLNSQFCSTITWRYEGEHEFSALYMITKHLKHIGSHLKLNLPYVPNARMDRVQSSEEIFTLKYFCKFINELNFQHVFVKDVHSHVALALLDRVFQMSLVELRELITDLKPDYLFFPDEGAKKRYASLAQDYDIPVYYGTKERDWKTGRITNFKISEQPIDAKILMIDDICSYGGTFYYSIREHYLHNLKTNEFYLYVTHCENSILKGDLAKSNLVKHVYTTKSIFTAESDWVTVLE